MTEKMPDSKCAAAWSRMVAVREAEYRPPDGIARIWSRMRLLYLPGAIWATPSCPVKRSASPAAMLATVRFKISEIDRTRLLLRQPESCDFQIGVVAW